MDSEAEEVEENDEEEEENVMDADDRENSELMSSHNIERCVYYSFAFASVAITYFSDEELSENESMTTQNDELSDTVMPSEDDEPDTRPQVERTPKATRYVIL